MTTSVKHERRQSKSRHYRLTQPIFTQIPKAVAAPALVGSAIAILAINHLAAPEIWFGPVYLLICAFSAWFVGNRFAVMLCILVTWIQILNGQAVLFRDTEILTVLNMVLQISSALAVVLMLGVAREALEIEWRFARLDPLTGALNRKAFFEAVAHEGEDSRMAVLVFADVDGLKRMNDTQGHEAGDEALRDFADRIRKAIRKSDPFARIGGDEFVIMLNVKDGAAARIVAERLNRVLNLELVDDPSTLKCSLGVLVMPAGSKNIDTELKQADTLMYLAKKERAGLVMATSVKGDLQKLIPCAPDTNVLGQQRAVVRKTERNPQPAASEVLSQESFVA